MRAGIRELRIKAEDKILRVDRLVGADILDQRGGSRNDGVALRNAQVLEIGERGDGGVERRNGGSQLRDDAAAGTDAGAPGPRGRAIGIDTDAAQADAHRTRRHALTDAAQQAAALRAPQHFAGQQRPIALHFDVDVVLENESHHIGGRKIQIARANQRLNARRIGQTDRRNRARAVRAREPRTLCRVDSHRGLAVCGGGKQTEHNNEQATNHKFS